MGHLQRNGGNSRALWRLIAIHLAPRSVLSLGMIRLSNHTVNPVGTFLLPIEARHVRTEPGDARTPTNST